MHFESLDLSSEGEFSDTSLLDDQIYSYLKKAKVNQAKRRFVTKQSYHSSPEDFLTRGKSRESRRKKSPVKEPQVHLFESSDNESLLSGIGFNKPHYGRSVETQNGHSKPSPPLPNNPKQKNSPSSVDQLVHKITAHFARNNLGGKGMIRSRRSSQSASGEHKNGYPYCPDFENNVIVKQRKELQLLVNELRERDNELNDLVASHQKQMTTWESDRKRVLHLEEKVRQKDQENQDKTNQLKSTMTRLEDSMKQNDEKASQINELQKQNDRLVDDVSHLRAACEELEDSNYQLDRRLRETSSQLVQVETRSSQLEQDVHTAAQNLHTLLHKLKSSDNSRNEFQKQVEDNRVENDQLRNEIRKLATESRDTLRINDRLQQQVSQLQKDVQLAVERERRKEELIQSQRLKQERTDAELHQLRGMYERMQRDLSALHSNLETSRDQLEMDVETKSWASRSSTTKPPQANNVRSHHQPPTTCSSARSRRSDIQPTPTTPVKHHTSSKLSRVNSLPDLTPRDLIAEKAWSKRWTNNESSDYTKHLPSSYTQIDKLLSMTRDNSAMQDYSEDFTS